MPHWALCLVVPLERRFPDSQIVIITNFVVVSSVSIKRVVCIFIFAQKHKLRRF